MIRLKDIVKNILKEGPEEVEGHGWMDSSCVGPFLIFRNDAGKAHYALSLKASNVVVFDDEPKEPIESSADTHGGVINVLRKKFGINVGRHDYDNSIHGRVWEIDGTYYVATWNTINQIKHFGLSDFIDNVNNMMHDELVGAIDQDKILINPFPSDKENHMYAGKVVGEYIPLSDFSNKASQSSKDSELTLKQQEIDRKLHMMSPEVRQQFLKAKGIPTKTGDMPDWKKRAMMGVDEVI